MPENLVIAACFQVATCWRAAPSLPFTTLPPIHPSPTPSLPPHPALTRRAAPELLLGAESTTAADIYSFGVCLYEIVTGEMPVRGQLRMPNVPVECPQASALGRRPCCG